MVRVTGLAKPARKLFGPMAARFIFNRSENSGRPLMIQGHKMFLAPKGRYPSPDMVVDRYEPATTKLFEQSLRPGMVFVDIGANVGYFSLIAANLVGSAGKVYAFEPAPENHAVLRRNIELNGYSNIQPVEKAVSHKSETTLLYLSALDSGSHSLSQEAARGIEGDFVQVSTTTLDSFFEGEAWPNVDLVKIDVEGGELGVLEGMDRFFERITSLKMIIEYCPFLIQSTGADPLALLNKLASMNFQVQFMDDKKGILPLESVDPHALTARLLKQQTYINIVCSRV